MTKDWNADPLNLMTQVMAKRFEEVLNILIQDAKLEGAHMLNSKEETKMVHIIKVNPKFDQSQDFFWHYLWDDLLLILC